MGDTQAAPPWYPLSLVDTVVDSASFPGGLPSPWGRLRGWDYTDALSPSWWSDLEEDRWGDWPADIKEVKVTGETRQGVVVDLDGRWTAHLFPFPTGQDISSLVRYGPWATTLQEAPLVLPVAGLVRGDDLVAFSPSKPSTGSSGSLSSPPELLPRCCQHTKTEGVGTSA